MSSPLPVFVHSTAKNKDIALNLGRHVCFSYIGLHYVFRFWDKFKTFDFIDIYF